jgi:predicted GIY-YIG superfamily endonuclease
MIRKLLSKIFELRHIRVRLNRKVTIYAIRVLNTQSKVIYVGQTTQPLEKRFVQHISASKKNAHKNKFLENYLNDNANCCVIEPLAVTNVDRAYEIEKKYIAKYRSSHLTNIAMVGSKYAKRK